MARKAMKRSAKPKARARAKKAAATSASRQARRRTKAVTPIELYYWPTPNGFKISIMLEECKLPYTMIPVNISRGEQFRPAFLKISPNNRMPAIVDPHGPGGRPISVFESGAILQYLGRKTGKFYPAEERARVEVEQWLFWQMGGLGPMAGQLNHFKHYAKETLPYAIKRYEDEVNRLYGVMNTRLKDRAFLAGKYSIADMACVGWVNMWKRQDQNIDDFPHLKRWLKAIEARPATQRAYAKAKEVNPNLGGIRTPEERAILFGQTAASVAAAARAAG
jgi:glutathione S-transferase